MAMDDFLLLLLLLIFYHDRQGGGSLRAEAEGTRDQWYVEKHKEALTANPPMYVKLTLGGQKSEHDKWCALQQNRTTIFIQLVSKKGGL